MGKKNPYGKTHPVHISSTSVPFNHMGVTNISEPHGLCKCEVPDGVGGNDWWGECGRCHRVILREDER